MPCGALTITPSARCSVSTHLTSALDSKRPPGLYTLHRVKLRLHGPAHGSPSASLLLPPSLHASLLDVQTCTSSFLHTLCFLGSLHLAMPFPLPGMSFLPFLAWLTSPPSRCQSLGSHSPLCFPTSVLSPHTVIGTSFPPAVSTLKPSSWCPVEGRCQVRAC